MNDKCTLMHGVENIKVWVSPKSVFFTEDIFVKATDKMPAYTPWRHKEELMLAVLNLSLGTRWR
jgi:hypothetical protein